VDREIHALCLLTDTTELAAGNHAAAAGHAAVVLAAAESFASYAINIAEAAGGILTAAEITGHALMEARTAGTTPVRATGAARTTWTVGRRILDREAVSRFGFRIALVGFDIEIVTFISVGGGAGEGESDHRNFYDFEHLVSPSVNR
jgi:hypothetical protein